MSGTSRFRRDLCPEERLPPPSKKLNCRGGATQLSLPLGHSDWPVNHSKPPIVSAMATLRQQQGKVADIARVYAAIHLYADSAETPWPTN
jgi:hypothetical protein